MSKMWIEYDVSDEEWERRLEEWKQKSIKELGAVKAEQWARPMLYVHGPDAMIKNCDLDPETRTITLRPGAVIAGDVHIPADVDIVASAVLKTHSDAVADL